MNKGMALMETRALVERNRTRADSVLPGARDRDLAEVTHVRAAFIQLQDNVAANMNTLGERFRTEAEEDRNNNAAYTLALLSEVAGLALHLATLEERRLSSRVRRWWFRLRRRHDQWEDTCTHGIPLRYRCPACAFAGDTAEVVK